MGKKHEFTPRGKTFAHPTAMHVRKKSLSSGREVALMWGGGGRRDGVEGHMAFRHFFHQAANSTQTHLGFVQNLELRRHVHVSVAAPAGHSVRGVGSFRLGPSLSRLLSAGGQIVG